MDNTFGINIIPENDADRLNILRRYQILETPPEDSFNNIAELATQIFNVPIALVSLVAEEKVFFKANVGMGNARVTGRGISLCSLAVLKPEVTVFEDATKEPCLIANPLVAGEFGLKFYAGAPLITHDGFEIGTMCIVDRSPRLFSEKERVILQGLAKIVMDAMELRLSALLERQKQDEISEAMAASNEELAASNEEQQVTNEELEAANQELVETQIAMQLINEQLKESESRFRRLVQEAPAAIFVLKGPDMVFEIVNDRMYRMLGKSSEIIGKAYAEAVPELVGQPFFDLLDNVYTTGETFYGNEIKGTLDVDGQPVDGYFNFIYQPVTNEQGKVTGIMCMAIDVVEQVKARKTVERAEESLRIATESGELGTWYYDPSLDYFYTSARFNKIFGLFGTGQPTFEEAFSKIIEDDRTFVQEAISKSIEHGIDFNVEYRIAATELQPLRWVRAVGKTVSDENGSRYITGVIADITEQKQDEQRKNDFIGMVSHELKTPLTSMSGYVQMLNGKAKKAEDTFTLNVLNKAQNQVKKMTTMINGFLNVSRLESGKIHINRQLFDMAELVKETEEESIATISSHKVIFAPVVETIVMADRDKIGQVINNLISNAVKYSPNGSIINVACVTVNDKALVSVKDQGMGIAPKDIDRLFERYYRVDSHGTSAVSGFGIGLYLCSEIIQRHDGNIGVESTLGQGSTFWFTLPVNGTPYAT